MGDKPHWATSDREPIGEKLAQQLDREVKEGRLYARGVETLPPPALAIRELTDDERGRRRLSPRGTAGATSPRSTSAFDALERKQQAIMDELQALTERHRAAEQHDQHALAAWVASQDGDRPAPTAPDVQRRIDERRADWDALTIAVSSVLAEKAAMSRGTDAGS